MERDTCEMAADWANDYAPMLLPFPVSEVPTVWVEEVAAAAASMEAEILSLVWSQFPQNFVVVAVSPVAHSPWPTAYPPRRFAARYTDSVSHRWLCSSSRVRCADWQSATDRLC